ncbi:MAG TPA: 1-(5-phosphoribosyl)-5-[(5-phosphoribosylamino)methylideneamino] imidazole-4-carboxamide isomerase, partial [Myxococcaceae bacterium]|nr:1-(5-phosphoribosyl)-5-[(5-phosphoribosylamino)methylideneamino] imidazole-4-carboxamide isomerase [Myxococcaceae bacterium]
VDLREGACVQLVGGAYDQERVRLSDPVQVARLWQQMGFRRLHVIDLDAATGRSSNAQVVQALLAEKNLQVQVGGGVRSDEQISQLLSGGARWIIVGTRALEEPDWLRAAAQRHPGELIVAADVRGRNVVTRGWQRVLRGEILGAVKALSALPLAAILITAVHREGQMQGTDLALMREAAQASALPIYASGGISSADELRALAKTGVAAAVLGMALYTGALDGRAIAQEFAA